MQKHWWFHSNKNTSRQKTPLHYTRLSSALSFHLCRLIVSSFTACFSLSKISSCSFPFFSVMKRENSSCKVSHATWKVSKQSLLKWTVIHVPDNKGTFITIVSMKIWRLKKKPCKHKSLTFPLLPYPTLIKAH